MTGYVNGFDITAPRALVKRPIAPKEVTALEQAEAEVARQRRLLQEFDHRADQERVEVYIEGKAPSLKESWWFAYGERRAQHAKALRALFKAREAKR